MTLNVVALSGSLHAPSKSSALLAAITGALAAKTPIASTLVEVSRLPGLGSALRRDQLEPESLRALEQVESADLLVVASPVYRASYTGLFKHLFDLAGQTAFTGKPVLVAATGGSDQHSLVIEHQLRPLFGFFGAFTLPVSVYANDSDYTGYEITSPELLETIDLAATSAAGLSLERQRKTRSR